MCVTSTQSQAPPSEILIDLTPKDGVLGIACLMLFNPNHLASRGTTENSWDPSALKLLLPGNSQMGLHIYSSSLR